MNEVKGIGLIEIIILAAVMAIMVIVLTAIITADFVRSQPEEIMTSCHMGLRFYVDRNNEKHLVLDETRHEMPCHRDSEMTNDQHPR